MEEWINMEIYESFNLKGHCGIWLYDHCRRRREKYLTVEEISFLLMCKYDQITSPRGEFMKDLGPYPQGEFHLKDFGLYPQGDKYFFGRMT